MGWTVTFFDMDVELGIFDLPAGLLALFIRYSERMEVFGPNLGMPHTRAMGGRLFELRLNAGEGIARVFYCTIVDQRIVMLHHFIKKPQKTPRKELEIARKRLRILRNA